jgi:uncharacterized protein (DUF2235 family)
MSQAIKPVASDGTKQLVSYDAGVGTGSLVDKISGGAFGSGMDGNIKDAYRLFVQNYNPRRESCAPW